MGATIFASASGLIKPVFLLINTTKSIREYKQYIL